jgi:hypothetical protein
VIYDHDQAVARLDDSAYDPHLVQPGLHSFSLKQDDAPVTLEVEPGQRYFIKWNYRLGPAHWKYSGYVPYLVLMDQSQALEEIKHCRLMEEVRQ